jgi:glyoxylase-like metal-dependent hydrolase (beta-lactamase superfamily II)
VRTAFVNVYFLGRPGPAKSTNAARANSNQWVLVDAGLAMGAAEILSIAANRFGVESRPASIVLTHGHFDHVSGLDALLAVWDVPVYAHTAELPFLTGRADYPSPDPTVGGGIVGRLAPLVPETGIDLGDRVRALPLNGRVPDMPGWRWIHTPGHSPGHVSLFRPVDRVLIAGDAVATTDQESVYGSLTQRKTIAGPPAYFTIDWDKAERSMATLASLRPTVLAAGHGEPVAHLTLAADFAALARDFDSRVRPTHGRYVVKPAFAEDDPALELPLSARGSRVRWGALSGVAAATFAGTWLYRRFGRRLKP